MTNQNKRCEAMTYTDTWYRESQRCGNDRVVKINGKKLCLKHASSEAIAIAISEKKAVQLPESKAKYKFRFVTIAKNDQEAT